MRAIPIPTPALHGAGASARGSDRHPGYARGREPFELNDANRRRAHRSQLRPEWRLDRNPGPSSSRPDRTPGTYVGADRVCAMSESAVQITQTIVAGAVGVVAAATTLVGVLMTRSEPRALKELSAINGVLKTMPAGDTRDNLLRKRDQVAERYASRGQVGPEAVGLIAFGIGASSLLIVGALTSFASGTLPQFAALLVVALEIVLSLLGLVAICFGIFALIWTSLHDVRVWIRDRKAARLAVPAGTTSEEAHSDARELDLAGSEG